MATFLTVPVTVPIEVPPITIVFVERGTSATGPWVRIGQREVTGTTAYFYDSTAAFDTRVWYRFVYDLSGSEIAARIIVRPPALVGRRPVLLAGPCRRRAA